MTIDEAIKHCEEVVARYEKQAANSMSKEGKEYNCSCATDHRQLAEWLKELKEAKRLLKAAVEDLTFESQCRNCKYQQTGLDNICNGCRGNKYEWRYADETEKLLNDEKINNVE